MLRTVASEGGYAPAVGSHFADRITDKGDCLAAVDEFGGRISYPELAARADALAAVIGADRRLILLEATNSVEWLVAYVAALRGRHPVLMIPAGDAAMRQALELRFRPAFRLTAKGCYVPEPLEENVPPPLHPHLALLLSTSGSTGSMKLVRLSRSNVESNAASIAEYLQLGPNERGAVNLPTHYSYGLSIVNSHLHAGATVLLTSQSVIDPQFWSFLRENGATSFAGVPHVYDLLGRIDLVSSAPPTLRYFTQAGGRLPGETAATFAKLANQNGWQFFIMYGQTEATARIAFLPPDQALHHPDCVGVAIPGGLLELVDDHGHLITEKETDGELVYRGPNVMMGYATSPDDLESGPDLDRLVTGDLARLTDAGLYRVTGRRSRFVKILGNRIGLDDIEARLSSQGYHAIATGIDDQLLVVSRDIQATAAMRSFLCDLLKLPAGYIEVRGVEQYPLLQSGKFDYAGLKASLTTIANQPRAAAATKGDTAAAAVMAAFNCVFGDAAHDDGESFTSLGGDSLNYVLVVLALEELIPELPSNWETMSIAALTRLAEQQTSRAGLPTIESGVLLRAVAILGVVSGHCGIQFLSGGSGILMLLLAHNLARFRMPAMLRGQVWSNVADYLRKLVVPYAVLNLLYMVEKGHFTLVGLTALSNFWGPQASPSLFPQWFIEVAAQCVLIIGALLSVSSVRRAIAREPFRALLVLLGLAVIARLAVPLLWDTEALYNRVPWMFLPRFFIAWMIVLAHDNRRRLAITAIALAFYILRGFSEGSSSLPSLITLGCATLALLWLPRLSIPRLLRGPIGVPAAAVFYLYMLHEVFMYMSGRVLGWNSGIVLLIFGMTGPILTWWVVEKSGFKLWLTNQISAASAPLSRAPRTFVQVGSSSKSKSRPISDASRHWTVDSLLSRPLRKLAHPHVRNGNGGRSGRG